MCGGVDVDLEGRTEIDGLFAVGEVACTGVHGANRLASNSLLEALVFAHRAAHVEREAESRSHPEPPPAPGGSDGAEDAGVIVDHEWDAVRRLLWDYVGLVRSMDRLDRAVERLAIFLKDAERLAASVPFSADVGELRNIVLVGALLACSARARRESRGLHLLTDHPHTDPMPCETRARIAGGEIRVELTPLRGSS
jgi:L-aspartate oxidase